MRTNATSSSYSVIHTRDPRMKEILALAEQVALSRATVMITGESGTGKELLARFIHAKSQRSLKRFVAVNCAALPEGLLESELFGYEKGAFTGADSRKPGKFEAAHESTFLLDEISEIPLMLQAKLLRVLQESEVERLGAMSPTKINVRVIATSNQNLRDLVSQKRFREDLFYRLNVVPIEIPPLRSRPRDIEFLARYFVEIYSTEQGRPTPVLTASALDKLLRWSWPGNIRELENTMSRSVLLAKSDEISSDEIWLGGSSKDSIVEPSDENLAQDLRFSPGETLSAVEKKIILKTLQFTNQNRSEAARLLGISIRTLRNKIREYRETGVNL